MRFSSVQVTGKGRGKLLGFPTINLKIPREFDLKDGIYAVRVFLGDKRFVGAMHFGPIPTFKESEKTLEIFLIDTKSEDIPETQNFEVEILKYLRPVLNFNSEEELSAQIGKDVIKTRQILDLL